MNRDEYYAALYANRAYVEEHSDELKHWGIKGQKWGLRRYQNPDGTLTEEGKKHYGRLDKGSTTIANYHMKRASNFAKKVIDSRISGNTNKERKNTIKALADIDVVKNKAALDVESEAVAKQNRRGLVGHLLLGIPGNILMSSLPNKERKESRETYKSLLREYGDMSMSDLQKKFNSELYEVEKRKTSYKEYAPKDQEASNK